MFYIHTYIVVVVKERDAKLETIAWLTCFYIVFGLFHRKNMYKKLFDVINFNVKHKVIQLH